MRSTLLTSFLSFSLVALPLWGCSSSDGATGTSDSPATSGGESESDAAAATDDAGTTTSTTTTEAPDAATVTDKDADATDDAAAPDAGDSGKVPVAEPDPGPKPTAACEIKKGSDGFFVRNSGKSSYVAYVPASYTGDAPMRLIVGLHGCGDNAKNFATWGVNPYDTRARQEHIGISVDGASGGNGCWSMGGDDDKVLAAVEDISKCVWVNQKKITLAGYSSGGQLAYRVGLKNAARFAGIMIENSGLYAADSDPDSLVANAARKIPIAHLAHQNDSVFAIAKVRADWAKLEAAGFPLKTTVVAGDHNGSSTDWTTFLIPASCVGLAVGEDSSVPVLGSCGDVHIGRLRAPSIAILVDHWRLPRASEVWSSRGFDGAGARSTRHAELRVARESPDRLVDTEWSSPFPLCGYAAFPYTPAAMKRVTFFGAAVALTFSMLGSGCSRNNIEAVNLANEGDQARGTDIDGAISKYEQAVSLDPTNHRILWKLALAYTKKEAWDKVATTCAKAEKVAPKWANYFYQHGMALARQAEKGPTSWADVKGPLEQSIQLDPNGPNYPVGAEKWDGRNAGSSYFELAEAQLHLDDEAGALQSYTKAIEAKPDNLSFYGPLAQLYIELYRLDEAEQVLQQAVSFGKQGDKALFNIHSLLGQVADMRGDTSKAVTEYAAAKAACGPCNEPGQPIAFFNLGAAYATMVPPKKSEAIAQLQSFQKMICKGAAAARYAGQCSQAQQLASKLGGTLQ